MGDAFVVAARSGSAGADDRAPLRLPLAHQGEVVGELVLVADDHPLFRSGMRALVAVVPDTQLVGEAATGEEAVVRARKAGLG